MAVCEGGGLDLDRGEDAGLLRLAFLVLLLQGFREIGHVALYLLVVLLTVAGIGIVGVLDAVGRYGLLVAEHHLAVLASEVLLVEHALQKTVIGGFSMVLLEDGVCEITNRLQAALQCVAVRAVHGLGGVFLEVCLRLKTHVIGETVQDITLEKLHKRAVDKIIA